MKKKHLYTAVILLLFLAAGIQPALAIHFIPSDTSIGTLNGQTFTLNTNVTGTIQIDASDLTLEGAGFTITPIAGENTVGIFVSQKTGITIQNVTIEKNIDGLGFDTGIQVLQSENITLTGNNVSGCDVGDKSSGIDLQLNIDSTLTNNIVSNNSYGIRLSHSYSNNTQGNTLTTNNISNNNVWGIYLYTSNYNELTGNQISSNAGGIWLDGSDDNTLTSNTVTDHDASGIYLSAQSGNNTLTNNTSSSNRDGIFLNGSSNNTLTGNTTSSNEFGIKLVDSSDNILTGNTTSNNDYGIWLDPSINNQINNNNFINNTTQASVADDSIVNDFNGNYWSDLVEGSDTYVILSTPSEIEIKDNSPWPEQDGWVEDTTPPEITCPGDTTIEAMAPDGVPIEDDRIQTFLAGASATDNNDPPEDIIITNNAPALFPPGDTVVTFTATDTSDNSSTCQSTVTVVEAAESSLRIIPRIINREGRLTKILAVIRFPVGTTAEDIDIGQSIILYPGDSLDSIEAINQRIVTWYRCGVLRVSIFASFSKDEVTAGVPENGPAEMMVIGRFTSGQYFYGFDNVWIISWDW